MLTPASFVRVGFAVLTSALFGPAMAQDPNLDWARRNLDPIMRGAAQSVRQYNEQILAGMNSEQRQFHAACVAQGVDFETCVQIAALAPNLRASYVQCLSAGGTASNCMFAANLNQQNQVFQEEMAALQNLVPACDAGNAQACAQADAIIDAQRGRRPPACSRSSRSSRASSPTASASRSSRCSIGTPRARSD